jgi:CRISPR type III-B/RAMP module RAMP protein Cmr1
MKTLFDELLETSYGCTTKINQQNVSVKDAGDVWAAEIILAGFSKKDVSITADNETLKIEANNDERQSKRITLSLNSLVAIDQISSKLQDGILKLKLPKISQVKKISINVD